MISDRRDSSTLRKRVTNGLETLSWVSQLVIDRVLEEDSVLVRPLTFSLFPQRNLLRRRERADILWACSGSCSGSLVDHAQVFCSLGGGFGRNGGETKSCWRVVRAKGQAGHGVQECDHSHTRENVSRFPRERRLLSDRNSVARILYIL